MTGQSTPRSIPATGTGGARGTPPSKLLRGLRPLKRWRYVGIFSEELMACAALAQIGPARQSFWAMHLHGEQDTQRERTRLRPRSTEVVLTPGRLRVSDRGVTLDLALEESPGIEVTCPNGKAEVWTRKQAGVSAHGTLSLDGGAPQPIDALAVIDDTAGHHARKTEWWWSAGVGSAPNGAALAWNLVSGVNDPPSGSERAVWVDGQPTETEPVEFAADLSRITSADGAQLEFSALSERSRSDDLLIVRSDYRAPFGVFSGTLPGGVALARGLGVMEHHRARW